MRIQDKKRKSKNSEENIWQTRRNGKYNEKKKMEENKIKFPILHFAAWRDSILYPGE